MIDAEDLTDAVWVRAARVGFLGQAVGVALQLPWEMTFDGGAL
jgi:hypothetical protein